MRDELFALLIISVTQNIVNLAPSQFNLIFGRYLEMNQRKPLEVISQSDQNTRFQNETIKVSSRSKSGGNELRSVIKESPTEQEYSDYWNQRELFYNLHGAYNQIVSLNAEMEKELDSFSEIERQFANQEMYNQQLYDQYIQYRDQY